MMSTVVKKVKELPSKLKNRFTKKRENAENTDQTSNYDLTQNCSFFEAVSECVQRVVEWNGDAPTPDELRTICYECSVQYGWIKQLVIDEAKKCLLNPSETFDEQTLWNDYLSSLKLKNDDLRLRAFVPEIEGKIICQHFNLGMHILYLDDPESEVDWFDGSKVTKILNDEVDTSKIIHIINIGNQRFIPEFQDHCCAIQDDDAPFDNEEKINPIKIFDLRQEPTLNHDKISRNIIASNDEETVTSLNTDQVESILVEFVSKFVKEFEAKIASYVMITEGEVKKAGKFSDSYAEKIGQISGGILGGAIGLAIGLPGAGSQLGALIGGKVSKEVGNKLGSEHHVQKVTNLTELIENFQNDQPNFHQMLVEIGLDLFQSFELQFGRVTSDLGAKGAMQLLARDAMNRAIQYVSKCPLESAADLKALILRGVTLGQSKVEPILNTPIPNPHKMNLGFTIKYVFQDFSRNWKTASLFGKVGLVTVDETGRKYYKTLNGECKSEKYGFRRCFESENWDEGNLNYRYAKTNLINQSDQFSNYSYIFEPHNLKTNLNYFEKIERNCSCDNNNCLEAVRVKELLNETKDEILDELNILKTISAQIESDSNLLISIESNIKNLNIEKYFNKLQAGISNILLEIKAGREEHRKRFEELGEKIDELKVEIKSAKMGYQKNNLVKNAIAKIIDKGKQRRNSDIITAVWFGVQDQVKSFTGRVDIMKQIENELEKGIVVVIYGMRGVGKSQLLIKYAGTRYTNEDNVIWINAENQETIADACFRLAQKLNVDAKDDDGGTKPLSSMVNAIYEQFSQRKSLIILDNTESLASVDALLTQNYKCQKVKPKIIILSRQKFEGENEKLALENIELTSFNRSEATNFVKKSLSIAEDSLIPDIDRLIVLLNSFPLALQHAVSYIKNSDEKCKERNLRFTINDYLELFKNCSTTNLKLPSNEHESCAFIHDVLKLTLEKLESDELGQKALFILKLSSFLAPNNIPQELFLGKMEDAQDLMNITKILETYSLISLRGHYFYVHHLLRVTIKKQMNEQDEVKMLEKVLELVVKQLTKKEQTIIYAAHIVVLWKYAYTHDALIKKFIINLIGNKSVYAPFIHFLVESGQMEIVNEIIVKIKAMNSKQLIDVLNEKNNNGERPIHFAVKSLPMMKLLVENGATVNAKNYFNWTPLHLATKFGQLEVVKFLIERGHKVDLATGHKYTALHFSAKYGNLQITEYLLANNANANAADIRKLIPLHFAVKGNHLKVVRVLLENETVNIDAETENKLAPLHYACRQGYLDIATLLISKGANCNAVNNDLFTPLHYAILENHKHIVDLLIKCEKVDVNAQTNKGNTALHLAAEKGNLEIIKVLMEKNPDVDIKNNDGKLAFDLAREEIQNYMSDGKNPELVKATFSRKEGNSGSSGQLYAIELAMLFLLEGVKKNESKENVRFMLAANMKDAYDFADVVFKYRFGNGGNWKVIFMGAKHTDSVYNEKEKITFDRLLSSSSFKKQVLRLKNYFISYRKIKNNFRKNNTDDSIFSESFDNCEFVVFTNADVAHEEFNHENILKFEIDESNFLSFIMENKIYYQFSLRNNENDKQIIEALINESECKKLCKELIKNIFPNDSEAISEIHNRGLVKKYYSSLTEKVFVNSNGQQFGFQMGFLHSENNLTPDDNIFRNSFFAELKMRNEFAEKTELELIEHMKNIDIKLINFETEGEKNDFKFPLPFDVVTNEEIIAFFQQFKLCFGQPSEEQLKNVIKSKIQSAYNVDQADSETVYAEVKQKIETWCKNSDEFLTKNNRFYPKSLRIPICFDVKKPARSFTGRKDELKGVHDGLHNSNAAKNSPQILSVFGGNGVGKSELARQYVAEYGKHYEDNIIWINADSRSSVGDSVRRLATESLFIEIQNANGKAKSIDELMLEIYLYFSKRKALFIFDNAPQLKNNQNDEEGFEIFLPKELYYYSIFIIITSRHGEWDDIPTLPLDVFAQTESVEFVNRSVLNIDKDEEDVIILVEQLQNLPLALTQAISYIKVANKSNEFWGENYFTVKNYSDLFEKNLLESEAAKNVEKNVLNFNPFSEYQNFISEPPVPQHDQHELILRKTWKIATKTIKQSCFGKQTLQILNILAYLAPNRIPILQVFSNFITDEKVLRSATESLQRFSLVTLKNGKVDVHEIVQRITRNELEKKNKSHKTIKKTFRLIKIFINSHIEIKADCSKVRFILPHLDVFLDHVENFAATQKNPEKKKQIREEFVEDVLEWLTLSVFDFVDPNRQIYLLEKLLDIKKPHYGDESIEVAGTLSRLGNLI